MCTFGPTNKFWVWPDASLPCETRIGHDKVQSMRKVPTPPITLVFQNKANQVCDCRLLLTSFIVTLMSYAREIQIYAEIIRVWLQAWICWPNIGV